MPAFALTTTRALRALVPLFTVTARPGIALAGLGAVVLAVSKAQAAPASTGREPWATATGPLVGPPLPPVGFGVEPPGPVVLAGGGGTTTIGGAGPPPGADPGGPWAETGGAEDEAGGEAGGEAACPGGPLETKTETVAPGAARVLAVGSEPTTLPADTVALSWAICSGTKLAATSRERA